TPCNGEGIQRCTGGTRGRRVHPECYGLSREIPIILSAQRSKAGSETPFLTLRRKYFSKAILAKCTHLPFLNQVTLRGGICGTATKAAPVSPKSARQNAFHDARAVASVPSISALMLRTMAVTIDSIM